MVRQLFSGTNGVNLPLIDVYVIYLSRKEGQDTQDELQRRNLREELEERERRHFTSKHKSYNGKNISLHHPIIFLLLY